MYNPGSSSNSSECLLSQRLYTCSTCLKLYLLFFSVGFPIKTSSSKQSHLYAVWVTRYLWVSQFVYLLIECQLAARHVIPIHLESLGCLNYYSFDFLPCWTIRKSNFSLQIKLQEKRHTVFQAMRFPSVYIRRMECSPRAKSNIFITNISKQTLDEHCQLNSCIRYNAIPRFSRVLWFCNFEGSTQEQSQTFPGLIR
jgi:hypothetical protein